MDKEKIFSDLLTKISVHWTPLKDKPDETPDLTLRALWFFAAGDPRTIIRVRNERLPELQEKQLSFLEELVNKRTNGFPLAYLIGLQDFSGIEFLTSSQAMIPRKETELLAKTALDKLNLLGIKNPDRNLGVLDLCTGSGIIALILAYYNQKCTCLGADISAEAIELAQKNARKLNLEERTNFVIGDLFSPFQKEEYYRNMDLITCNPPYISSSQMDTMPEEIRKYEPQAAFNGGTFGVNILMRIIRQAPGFLRSDSWLCFEVGVGQGNTIVNMIKRISGYEEIETFIDNNGNIRVVAAHYL